MVSIKINGYDRTPTKYDYELFSLLYYDFDKLEYSIENHPHLQINNWEHQERHKHNTQAITPINIIYSNKLIKLIRINEFKKVIIPMLIDLNLKSKAGYQIKTRKTLTRYSTQFFERVIRCAICSWYLMLSKEYPVNIAKKLTAAYTKLTLKAVNNYIKNESWGDILEQSFEGSAHYDETTQFVQNIEGYRKISYSNFSELTQKWMDLMYNEWLNHNQLDNENAQKSEQIAFFKKMINNRIDSFDYKNNEDEFYKFIFEYHERYGISLSKTQTTHQVKNMLKILLNKDSNLSEDPSFDNSPSSLDFSFDNHSFSKLHKSESDEDDLIITKSNKKIQKLNLSEIREEMSEDRSNLKSPVRELIWASFQAHLDFIQWVTLVYYFWIYNHYSKNELALLTNFSFSNDNSEKWNTEMIAWWKKIDKIYKGEKFDDNHMIMIAKFIDNFASHL